MPTLHAAVCERDASANILPKANRKDPICFSLTCTKRVI